MSDTNVLGPIAPVPYKQPLCCEEHARLERELDELRLHLTAEQIGTRCREHQKRALTYHCTVCGKPMSWIAGQEPPAYKELRRENEALRAVVQAVESAEWFDIEPGVEITKTMCLSLADWQAIAAACGWDGES